MAERKTTANEAVVGAFLDGIQNETRRQDSIVVAKLMQLVSGAKPKMWGSSIVGFGKHYYTYADGRPGEICRIGFAPRAQSLVFYLANFDDRAKLLQKWGKHRLGRGGCLYVNKLRDVDMGVLKMIIASSHNQRKKDDG